MLVRVNGVAFDITEKHNLTPNTPIFWQEHYSHLLVYNVSWAFGLEALYI